MTYISSIVSPSDLSEADIERCIELLRQGGEVGVIDLSSAELTVVHRLQNLIVSLGAIKVVREWYAEEVAKSAKFDFDKKTPEIGYIVTDEEHRNKGLADISVRMLLKVKPGNLWATTRTESIKKKLLGAGFKALGAEWKTDPVKEKLSLWLLEQECVC